MFIFDGLKELKRRLGYFKYKKISYSQEGEDLVLDRFLDGKTNGFYVDVGAHHPIRFSNTYYFYKRGWKGINIDAMPGSMKPFKKFRPRDINLEIPISQDEREIEFYQFNEPALNGFSKDISIDREENTEFKIIKTSLLKTQSLGNVLRKNITPGTEIDFFSIDVEGLDLEVLKSNDWNLFKPKFILVEVLEADIATIHENLIFQFLNQEGYSLAAKMMNTFIFRHSSGDSL
jgi:hypothetical protein